MRFFQLSSPRFNRILVSLMAGVFGLSAFICLGAPAVLVPRDLFDPALGGEGVSRRALELHRSVSERLEPWARARVASGAAEHVPLYNVAETEWPVFTAVFFLNSTEALADQGIDVGYAMPSVRAARDLLMDPGHHTWVRRHWGEDYLHHNNVFFRSLLIAGLTSYESLTHEGDDLDFLRDQVESLAADLDASPHGVLEDYPGETYPIDVLAAIAYIQRADSVLGTDHRAFVERARRAFVAPYDTERGFVRFRVDLNGDQMPRGNQPGRGIGNSWIGAFAPDLWPEDAARWHALHTEHFWQRTWWAEGFREWAHAGGHPEWGFEIDAGPIVGGFGTSASAFGIAAARRNGRLDQAFTLSAEMVATGWPTWGGALRLPRVVSHSQAPLLGEAAIAYFLTLEPAPGVPVVRGGRLTPLVVFALLVYFSLFGSALLLTSRVLRALRRGALDQRSTAALSLASFATLCASLHGAFTLFLVGGAVLSVLRRLSADAPRASVPSRPRGVVPVT